jgi:opacity protein-like surface antigen
VSVSDNSTDFTYGFGARLNFTRNFAARLEWQRYAKVGSSTTGSDDIDLFSLGLLYGFY